MDRHEGLLRNSALREGRHPQEATQRLVPRTRHVQRRLRAGRSGPGDAREASLRGEEAVLKLVVMMAAHLRERTENSESHRLRGEPCGVSSMSVKAPHLPALRGLVFPHGSRAVVKGVGLRPESRAAAPRGRAPWAQVRPGHRKKRIVSSRRFVGRLCRGAG